MEFSILAEYLGILLFLIVLEGILAADNALVLAVIVKNLPPQERKKALFYGLLGAFVFRLASLFAISLIVGVWQLQAAGALYLLIVAASYFYKKRLKGEKEAEGLEIQMEESNTTYNFWKTVLKVELADIAFAVDSILAAVALALALPATPLPAIGGMDGGQFLVVFTGGFVGLVIMRFAASLFVNLLERKKGLEDAAFAIVGWVGVKLILTALSHPGVALLPAGLTKEAEWKAVFYLVILIIVWLGWKKEEKKV